MNKDERKQLAAQLAEWFKQATPDKRNFWQRDEVAFLIKKEMEKLDRWKNLARGDARAGGKKKRENKLREIYGEPEKPDEKEYAF